MHESLDNIKSRIENAKRILQALEQKLGEAIRRFNEASKTNSKLILNTDLVEEFIRRMGVLNWYMKRDDSYIPLDSEMKDLQSEIDRFIKEINLALQPKSE